MKARIEYLDGVAGVLICYMMLNHIVLRANIGISVDNVGWNHCSFLCFGSFISLACFISPSRPSNC